MLRSRRNLQNVSLAFSRTNLSVKPDGCRYSERFLFIAVGALLKAFFFFACKLWTKFASS